MKIYLIITFLLVMLDLSVFVHFYSDAVSINSEELNKLTEVAKKESGKLDEVSKQILVDYPDLPSKVKLLLREFPNLASERVDIFPKLAESNKSLLTLIVLISFVSFLWGILTIVYFWRMMNR